MTNLIYKSLEEEKITTIIALTDNNETVEIFGKNLFEIEGRSMSEDYFLCYTIKDTNGERVTIKEKKGFEYTDGENRRWLEVCKVDCNWDEVSGAYRVNDYVKTLGFIKA